MFWLVSAGIFLVTLVCVIVFRAIAIKKEFFLADVFAYLSALAGGVGNIVYLCNQDIFRFWHVLLGIAFVAIPMLFLLIMSEDEDEVEVTAVIFAIAVILAAIFCISAVAMHNYDAAFVEQPDVVECEIYEIIAAQYDSDIHGTLTKYYRRVEGELTEDDLFKFYYLADGESGEMKLMTLNASEVSLYFVEEGEKPCWKVITITQSRVNSKTGEVEEEVVIKNELYVPSGSITPGYDLDVVE